MKKQFIYWLFMHSQKVYIKYKKKKAWNIGKEELLRYPKHTFGYALGGFLQANNYTLLPKVERHVAYHILTGYGTKVEDEVALQYLCFGNGKRSLYLLGVLLLGTILLPDYLPYFIKSYKLGKNCNQFYHFNFRNLLEYSFDELRSIIFTKSQILNI